MGGLLSLRNSIAVSNVSVPGGLGDESLRAKAGLGGRATGRLTVASRPSSSSSAEAASAGASADGAASSAPGSSSSSAHHQQHRGGSVAAGMGVGGLTAGTGHADCI